MPGGKRFRLLPDLRDLIAHHYFACWMPEEIIWEVAMTHVLRLLAQARLVQAGSDR
ncbi:MAG: hypothetical protein IPH49_16140 [Ignavibacteria bacterium]|nr:hypothetical protein [Ignavibacteria bacterium]